MEWLPLEFRPVRLDYLHKVEYRITHASHLAAIRNDTQFDTSQSHRVIYAPLVKVGFTCHPEKKVSNSSSDESQIRGRRGVL